MNKSFQLALIPFLQMTFCICITNQTMKLEVDLSDQTDSTYKILHPSIYEINNNPINRNMGKPIFYTEYHLKDFEQSEISKRQCANEFWDDEFIYGSGNLPHHQQLSIHNQQMCDLFSSDFIPVKSTFSIPCNWVVGAQDKTSDLEGSQRSDYILIVMDSVWLEDVPEDPCNSHSHSWYIQKLTSSKMATYLSKSGISIKHIFDNIVSKVQCNVNHQSDPDCNAIVSNDSKFEMLHGWGYEMVRMDSPNQGAIWWQDLYSTYTKWENVASFIRTRMTSVPFAAAKYFTAGDTRCTNGVKSGVSLNITDMINDWLQAYTPWRRRNSKLSVILSSVSNFNRRVYSDGSVINRTDDLFVNETSLEQIETDNVSDALSLSSIYEGRGNFEEWRTLYHGRPSLTIEYLMEDSCWRDATGKKCPEFSYRGTCACRIDPRCMNVCGLFCDFETDCNWNWTRPGGGEAGFKVYSFEELNKTAIEAAYHTFKGLNRDPKNETKDHILFLSLRPNEIYENEHALLWSPWYEGTSGESCRLDALISIYQFRNVQVPIKFLIQSQNNTVWIKFDRENDTQKYNDRWNRYKTHLGKINSRFRVLIEVTFGLMRPAYVAIDNIRMEDCFTDMPPSAGECCGIRCNSGNKCITPDHICDLGHDCQSGEDEAICDDMPLGSRCDFENNGTCGWKNHDENHMDWELKKGSSSDIGTHGQADHTYGNTSGHYMLSALPPEGVMGQEAMLESPIFPPPPCVNNNASSTWYQSCRIRFYYQKRGKNHGAMSVDMVPQTKLGTIANAATIMGDKMSVWMRFSENLPSTDYPYRIRITNVRGTTFKGNLAIDDFSLSPACFGIGLPDDMNEPCPLPETTTEAATTPPSYVSTIKPPGSNFWKLTPCGAKGHEGPIQSQCHEEYRKQPGPIPVVHSSKEMQGYQSWKIPQDGYYTLIAKGASGGSGIQTQKLQTSGAVARGVFFLKKNSDIHFLIGQEGMSACTENTRGSYLDRCLKKSDPPEESEIFNSAGIDGLKQFKNQTVRGGGGGGGGATYVFKKHGHNKEYLLVAGGGGGLAWESTHSITEINNGRGLNGSIEPLNGETTYYEGEGAGPGGGLRGERDGIFAGYPLNKGGVGGPPCATAWNTYGGFGGGGGSCLAGGGGGGYTGGNAGRGPKRHGEGGTSFITGDYKAVEAGANYGDGVVYIISAARAQCNCDYLCVYLDEQFNNTICLCDEDEVLAEDGYNCKVTPGTLPYALSTIAVITLVIVVGGVYRFCLYKNKKPPLAVPGGELPWPVSSGQGPMGRMTFNPNYEFNTLSLKDLKKISRDNLKFVKPLGQGAFGEVYKGYLRNYASDSVEMPVAVKTLPDISSNEAEMDFQMEAFIMYKFKHPNIVHFIGVCFEQLPRLIVLELLSGGDLKSFLREARPCPERPSPLAMKDLLQCAIDVSKGCKYLEEKHFIHRDIAARNCLLTSRGPGRVVKIADFGMARDIYRNDYYRKGGKAMLPVKWMPPEAFLDGIFTSKTDVWSFGVLLWEVMSLGYMPYPGRTNQEVMQLVTNGGRLEPPRNCPPPVYRIMTQCWHPNPDERPTFCTILERLGYCVQDPNVTSASLPVFQRPPSSERDATVMRPVDGEACLEVLRRPNGDAADYLMPLPSFSLAAVKSAFRSTPSLGIEKDYFQMQRLLDEATVPPPPTWETSFTDEPPAMSAPRRPNTPSESRSPPQLSNIQDDNSGASPLLISPPNSTSPPHLPRSQESREHLISPGEMETSLTIHPNNIPAPLHCRPRDRARGGHHYHPHRHNNSGSSNNSSSSTTSSSTGSNSSNNNSSSTASTLPLDPASLPCIPPPQQYVNVDVKKRSPDFTQEPYTIVETREHREISC